MAGLRALFALSVLSLSVLQAYSFSEDNPQAKNVLVLLDDAKIQGTHSLFFKSLADRGYELDFKLAKDSSLVLKKYGQFLYDAAIIFAPTTENFGGSVDVPSLLDFVDSGHDLLVALSSQSSEAMRELAAEVGIEVAAAAAEDTPSFVIDHQHAIRSSPLSSSSSFPADSLLSSSLLLPSATVVGSLLAQGKTAVAFRGVGLSLSRGAAGHMVLPLLSASPSAYSSSSPSSSSISLVAAMQGRNNARVTVSGSLEMFGDSFFRLPAGNAAFAENVATWTFQERGHIKALPLSHHRAGQSEQPAVYRIKDKLEFSMPLVQWSDGKWVPFIADDVQLEFFMMSAYVRINLTADNKGVYSTSFTVPDVYGVFQFKVHYARVGYATVRVAQQIPVRPFRHNEFERFIPSAFPYYASAFSMMSAFFVFGFAFLYHK